MRRVIVAVSLVLYVTVAQVGAAMALDPCSGCGCCDWDGSGDVAINDLILMVSIALGNAPLSACPPSASNAAWEGARCRFLTSSRA